jgi:hypothetical protein
MDEPDIEYLIKELAKTGADPFWVAEAISAEQEAEAARSGAAAGCQPTMLHLAARIWAAVIDPKKEHERHPSQTAEI